MNAVSKYHFIYFHFNKCKWMCLKRHFRIYLNINQFYYDVFIFVCIRLVIIVNKFNKHIFYLQNFQLSFYYLLNLQNRNHRLLNIIKVGRKMYRKLLYHRGVDDEVGTYITDYISSTGCFLLGTFLISHMFAQCCQAIRKTTIGVGIILFSLTLMSLLGGLTHEFLQLVASHKNFIRFWHYVLIQVEPYTSWTDNWTWLVVWRAAASFASLLIFAFFFISHQLVINL